MTLSDEQILEIVRDEIALYDEGVTMIDKGEMIAVCRAILSAVEKPAASPATEEKGLPRGWVAVPGAAVDWLKKHNPVLCEKSGLLAPVASPAAPVPSEPMHRSDLLFSSLAPPSPIEWDARPVDESKEIDLALIRWWPDGMPERLEHVWRDVIGLIPNYKLLDLQRTLAEFGYAMKVYEPAASSTKESK